MPTGIGGTPLAPGRYCPLGFMTDGHHALAATDDQLARTSDQLLDIESRGSTRAAARALFLILINRGVRAGHARFSPRPPRKTGIAGHSRRPIVRPIYPSNARARTRCGRAACSTLTSTTEPGYFNCRASSALYENNQKGICKKKTGFFDEKKNYARPSHVLNADEAIH